MKLERYKRKLQTKEKSLKEVRISRISHFIGNIFPLSECTIFPTLGTSPRGRMNLGKIIDFYDIYVKKLHGQKYCSRRADLLKSQGQYDEVFS